MAELYSLDGVAPDVDPSAWVAPGAKLMGKVRLLAGASVWFNAVLRGDNEWIEIGPGSNVQDGAVLHTDMGFPLTVGAECTIGHMAILHGCEVRSRALIGMGATVLNGAVIGEECLVGANALVTENKRYEEPGMLIVGAPAKPARTLDPVAREGLRGSALGYAKNAQRFRSGLRAL